MNVNGIAKVIEKSGELPKIPAADVIVYAEKGGEAEAFKEAGKLRAQGLIVENALFDDLTSVREYAMERRIAKVVVVDGSREEE